ncbi:MAG: D-alanyl-D-alanine carboxypeptidase [Urechidicola sp.]|jgi:CubicO group peptidase (beta-lactamase class C family)|uniref:serine hydrolase domain-containing protein n=1 Tax=Candidatus Marifrigoribacter sp. Uisw_064 TaxID=3230970 RepID=UPI003D38E6B2
MKNVIYFILFITNITIAQSPNYTQIDTYLETLFEQNKMMGSVSILQKGKEVYQKSVGYQYISENDTTLNAKASKYRIGSITKTFTATMIFQLVDEGKIKLEDPLSLYFPKLKNASKIKISNLLNHSSGLFNITSDENFDETIASTQSDMLSRIEKYSLDFQPGEKNEYSNTNYLLLGYILEQVEGRTYSEILKYRVTSKLGLKNTYYGGTINVNNFESVSYFYDEFGTLNLANQAHLSNPGGAGAIVSNPSDLILFMDALFSDKLMSAKSFNVMTTIKDDFGSGIFRTVKDGIKIFAHNGGIDRFKSFVVYIPELKICLAINANALDYGLMPLALNLLTVIKGGEIVIPSFESFEVSEEDLNSFSGTYSCEELPFDLIFETDGKFLKGAPEGSDLKQLKSTNKYEFVLESIGVHLKFNKVERTVLFTMAGETSKTFIKKQ